MKLTFEKNFDTGDWYCEETGTIVDTASLSVDLDSLLESLEDVNESESPEEAA